MSPMLGVVSSPLTADAYTAFHLPRLATFILHTPLPTLRAIFDPTSPCSIASLSLDPNVPKSDASTTSTCQRLFRALSKKPNISSETIPLTLCLLLRFRLQASTTALECDDHYTVIAAFLLAHKHLSDYAGIKYSNFATALQIDIGDLVRAEKSLLQALEYNVWVREEEFREIKEVLEKVWKEVCSKASKPKKPRKSMLKTT